MGKYGCDDVIQPPSLQGDERGLEHPYALIEHGGRAETSYLGLYRMADEGFEDKSTKIYYSEA
jgi:hypothetical protein